jgi:oligosaccharyl transferase (archaeosortase A-associated)
MARSGRKRKQPAGTVKGQAGRPVDEKAAQARESPVAESPGSEMTGMKPVRQSFDPLAWLRSGMWAYPVALLLLMALMAYIRIVPSCGNVFPSWGGGYVNVAQDDAVYQMRLVHNTLAHFPTRIMFDPFTHFPYGSAIHFGPLFTIIIAGAALVVGLGNPAPALVDTVGAYMPVLMGVLCILPAYFIASRLFGRNAGIIAAATLALIPGQFLSRSLIGFTDHHIAEVLFSAATVAFLVFALDAAKKSGLSLEKIMRMDRRSLKALAYSALAGIAFGCYMLNWPGALLLGFMLFIYFAVQSAFDHFRDQPLDYLVIVAAIIYLVPAVMVLPFSLQDMSLQLMFYSMTQPVFLCLAFAGTGVIYVVSGLLRRNKMENWTFPVTLVAIAVAGLLVAYIVLPQLFALVMAGFKVFTPAGGMLTVAEARSSIFTTSGDFTMSLLWAYFFWTLPISIIGIVMLAFRVLKDNRPAELLFLVWNLVMFWAMISQIRFTYYFAVNAALLTGYFAVSIFRAFDSESFVEKFRERVKGLLDLGPFLSKNTGPAVLMTLISAIFLLVIIYPATSLSTGGGSLFPGGYTMAFASGNLGMDSHWYNSLTWLRDHTPDPQGTVVQPGFDYANGTYARTLNADGTYQYPTSAYGVMSWWDYGHIINYVAHRIPNANPFQAGILENNGTDGSAKFFLATDESDGYRNLQDMGSRYVMIDNAMATGKFYAITVWAQDKDGWYTTAPLQVSQGVNVNIDQDSDKYRSSMMSRLYYDDCNGMSHFRLIYEGTGPYYVSTKVGDLSQYQQGYPYVPFTDATFTPSEDYTQEYNLYRATVNPSSMGQDSLVFYYDSRPPVKSVKTYEVVKGAIIKGSAPAGSNVTASVNLGVGRHNFTYTQTAVAGADGTFAMTVPYPTEAMKGDGYSYDVTPLSNYTITYGDTTKTVAVPEQAVMSGRPVNVV